MSEPLDLEARRDPGSADAIADATRRTLVALGEDPEREGLRSTPQRVSRALRFLTAGYEVDVGALINGALFDADGCDEIVVVKDVEVYSLCEHHLLPFHGRCHVGYLPGERIIGLSKVPRIVDAFARRLQVQERLTTQVAECLMGALEPRGVAVVIEAVHLCMSMRGVEKQGSRAVTSAMLGAFRKDRACRQEFLALIDRP